MDIKKPFRNPKRWRGKTKKNNGNTIGKTGRTDSGKDLSGQSRFPAEQGPTLHQQVFWLKHDAKIQHCHAWQFIGNVNFLCTAFLKFYFRPNGLNDALFVILFAIKKIMTRVTNCLASIIHLNFGSLFHGFSWWAAILRRQAAHELLGISWTASFSAGTISIKVIWLNLDRKGGGTFPSS